MRMIPSRFVLTNRVRRNPARDIWAAGSAHPVVLQAQPLSMEQPHALTKAGNDIVRQTSYIV